MGKISVVINTYNEEENLPRALESIKTLADEIVVVDTFSEDKTIKIAREAGAKVFKHKRTGYVEPVRNFAISKAKNEWILIIDADEVVPPSLAQKIKKITTKAKFDYCRLPRKNIIFGKWIKHARWWPDYNIRLFRKGSVSWDETIHSVPLTEGVGIDIPVSEKNAIIHHNYKSVSQFLDRLNRYTSIQAKNKKDFKWHFLIEKPAGEFFSRYFQGEGYKDGLHGLALSSLQAFSELILWLKVWEGQKKLKEENINVEEVVNKLKEEERNLFYWSANTLLKEKKSIFQVIKRRFKLR